ncbi:hypothetical protein BGZ63DRAFT_445803, partial [Mariannaea sp. PMI_226]
QCIRLQKKCEYPDGVIPDLSKDPTVDDRIRHLEQLLSVSSASGSPTISPSSDTSFLPLFPSPSQQFPLAFFLDSDFFSPIRDDALARSTGDSPLHRMAAEYLGQDPVSACEAYFGTVHKWLPMISRKRLMRELAASPSNDTCLMLLVLCMKLCGTEPEGHPKDSPLYAQARSLCSRAELGGFISLRLLQSLVLLTAYELSHGNHPAAFLTISRAARLGILMTLHDKNSAPQLFKQQETWTLCEEQRRTWWGIYILDRFVNIENSDLPFAAPEPSRKHLLPVNDECWEEGKIVPSEPLFTKSFSSITTIGSFAKTCQAAHMLSKVIVHKRARKSSLEDITELLLEAQNLHRAISALQLSLGSFEMDEDPASIAPKLPALTLCCSTRLLLYNQYACNEPGLTTLEPIALETEMQNVSLDCIKELASSTARIAARNASGCPMILQFLYHAATECAWFIKENQEDAMFDSLQDIITCLTKLREHSGLADQYMLLLEEGDVLKLVEQDRDVLIATSSI